MKPILVSGIQPTGKLHIGNYLGALKNFVELQNSGKYECFFFVADLHSLTEDFDPKEKKAQIDDVILSFIASGLDTKKSTIFVQSEISEHSELAWILNTITPFGELYRMTQFKDKTQVVFNRLDRETEGQRNGRSSMSVELATDLATNVGLFDYPVLMASDILLYDAKFVPVGNDQDQHLELARTLARKFNSKFGKTFIEPQALHTEVPRLMSLDDPEKKMSKSRPEGCLFLDDTPDVIRKKIKRAVTDSGNEVKFDEKEKPAISNLLLVYSAFGGKKISEIEKMYAGKGYGEFKSELAEIVVKGLTPFQEKKKVLRREMEEVMKEVGDGNRNAKTIALKKMLEIKKRIGLI